MTCCNKERDRYAHIRLVQVFGTVSEIEYTVFILTQSKQQLIASDLE